MDYIHSIPALAPFLKGSDYTDIKVFEYSCSMRAFIAGMLSYNPWWLKLLYRIRGFLVHLIGLERQDSIDLRPIMRPGDVSLMPGDLALFFIVRIAKDEAYWISETPEDRHLSAYFGVVVEPLDETNKRFYVLTIVKYKHWTGPVYFNLIRPFHHLVVSQMARAGAMSL